MEQQRPPTTLRIVALNDFHGALYERAPGVRSPEAQGGLPFLVSAVEWLRQQNAELIVLDGGDQFQGSWPVNQSRGRGSVQAMNLLGLDAAAIGNHEFDYGGDPDGDSLRGAFLSAADQANYPFLAANIRQGGAPWLPDGVQRFVVLERNGLRIGVVGLSTTETPTTTKPANVADLTFEDPVKAVRDLMPELEASNLDVTVLVGHLTGACSPAGTFDVGRPCTPDGEIGRLLTELPEGTFDVMVLGHAHTLLSHRVGQTFLLEQRDKGRALGVLDLVVTPEGVDVEASHPWLWPLTHLPADPGCSGKPFPDYEFVVGGVPLMPSKSALALIEELEAASGSLCEPVTCAKQPIKRARKGESALGNWATDAMLAAFPGADLAIQNAGGLRANLPEGEVRREHIHAMMPFENRTLLVEMTGAQVRTLLRIGSSGQHGLLQVAGARYRFDPQQTEGSDLDGDGAVADWERERLCEEVQIGGAPLEDEKTYRVVTNDFLFAGGDHLGPAFEGARIVDEGPSLRDVFDGAAAKVDGCLDPAKLKRASQPRIQRGTCRE
ncbi:MAG: bifunctional UDP-sugar hydrolase/5'-nucleotidase [Myxococcota bacterium]